MKTLMTAALLLALASLAEAQICPSTLDPQTYPYGGCICGASGIPMGGVPCPVVLHGSTLSCGCQTAGSPIVCYGPEEARCGGILPYCASKDICNLNSATVCLKGGAPTYAPDCYVGGLVNPLSGCTCATTTVKIPQTPEQKAAHCKLGALFSATSGLLTWLPLPGLFTGLVWAFPIFNMGLEGSALFYGALCVDPPRNDFTEFAELLPYPAVPYVFTTADGFYQNQADDLNALMASIYRTKRQGNVLLKALERSQGAAIAASPYYQDDQLDRYDEAADALHLEVLNMIALFPRFNTARWAARPLTPDMRYLFEPLYRQSTLDTLSEVAAVNLRAN